MWDVLHLTDDRLTSDYVQRTPPANPALFSRWEFHSYAVAREGLTLKVRLFCVNTKVTATMRRLSDL